MRSPNSHPIHPSEAGTICRVIRQGVHFYCGMCRSSYKSFSHAMSCVRECWEEILTWDPVISRPPLRGKVHFRCRFCARDYGAHDMAAQCAADCRERFKVRFALEMEAWGQVEDLSSKPLGRRRPLRPLKLVVLPVMKKKPVKEASAKDGSHEEPKSHGEDSKGKDEAPSHESSSPKEPQSTEVAADASSKSKESTSPPPKPKKASGEPFSRDGAQYVCNGCQKKYFTKDEVVKCFESHAAE